MLSFIENYTHNGFLFEIIKAYNVTITSHVTEPLRTNMLTKLKITGCCSKMLNIEMSIIKHRIKVGVTQNTFMYTAHYE